MVINDVDQFVAAPLLDYYEQRGISMSSCRFWTRSNLSRTFSRLSAGFSYNFCFWTIAIFLLSLLALWGHTFWFVAANIGFIPWFHAVYTPFKYIRLFGNIHGNIAYRCKPIASKPKYSGKDVTVIIPTITRNMEELVSPFQSIIDTGIAELIIVTVGKDLQDKCSMLAERLMIANPRRAKINVYSIEQRNKRIQLKAVLPYVTTKICALVDDDIWWGKNSLPWILAPFEDETIGSVGVGMAAHSLPEGRGFNLKTIFHYLGAEYLARRNFDGAATLYHDAGISCMSGRTNVLRTSILQDQKFLDAFVDECDLSRPGGPLLMNGEDKFITRWLLEHGIGMWVQYHPDAYLETTLELDKNFLQQCTRWASSSWRGNYKLLFPLGFTPYTIAFWTNLKVVSARQPWTFYSKYTTVFLSHTLITDPLFFLGHLMCQDIFAAAGLDFLTGASGWCIVISFYLFTKVVKKLSDLYLRDPWTILFFPISLVFGLFHNWIKFKTFVEIDKGWRTRGFDLIADTAEERDLVWVIRAILSVVIAVVEWTAGTAFWVIEATVRSACRIIFATIFYTTMIVSAAVHATSDSTATRSPCKMCKFAWVLDLQKMKTACMNVGYLRRCEAKELAPLLQFELEEKMVSAELEKYHAEQGKHIRIWAEIEDEKTPCNASACDYFSGQTISA